MPITTFSDPARGIRITNYSGALTGAELLDFYRTHQDDFDPSLNSLIDMREMDATNVSAGDIRAIEDLFRSPRFAAPRRVAFVASSAVQYGFARMYQELHASGPEDIRVFTEYDEALRWVEQADENDG